MQKLKNASGRTTRSALTMVATALETNEWWKTTLWTYVRELPALNEWGPKIGAYIEKLQHMTLTMESLTTLMTVVSDFGKMKLVLRGSVLETLADRVQQTALQLSKACHQHEQACTTAMVEQMQAIIAELAIVWPEENCYSLEATKLATCLLDLVSSVGRGVVLEYGDDLQDFLLQGEAAVDNVMEKTDAILEKLDEMKEGGFKLKVSAEEAKRMRILWVSIMEWLGHYAFAKTPLVSEEQINKIMELHKQWGPCMGLEAGAESHIQNCVQRLHGVRSAMLVLDPQTGRSIAEIMEQENFMRHFAALQQENLKMETAAQSLTTCLDKEFQHLWERLRDTMERSTSLATKISQALLKDSSEMLRKRANELKMVAGGRENGALWSDAITAKMGVKEMIAAYEQGSLHTVQPVFLVDGIAQLQQAHFMHMSTDRTYTQTNGGFFKLPFFFSFLLSEFKKKRLCGATPN